MTKSTPCKKCGRPLHKRNSTHHDFCKLVPPPDELRKYVKCGWSLMFQIWNVRQESLRNHFAILGIDVPRGKACRCGLRKTPNAKNHDAFCRKLFKHFDGRTAYEARQTLQELIKTYSISKLAKMYDVPMSTLNKHLQNLAIDIPAPEQRSKSKSDIQINQWLDELIVPVERIQEALKYFNIESVGREVGLTRYKAIRRFRLFGLDFHKYKEANIRRYTKKYGEKPNLKCILFDTDEEKYEHLNCPRCDMQIYENTDKLPPLALILDAKNGTHRCQPSVINQWTQEAIPLQRVKGGTAWKRRVNEKENKKVWQVLDRKTATYWQEGELLCRFCVAQINGQNPPSPPAWVKLSSEIVKTTTDDNDEMDFFSDDFILEDEVIYA